MSSAKWISLYALLFIHNDRGQERKRLYNNPSFLVQSLVVTICAIRHKIQKIYSVECIHVFLPCKTHADGLSNVHGFHSL